MWTGEGSDGPLTGIVTQAGFKFVHTAEGDQLSIQIGNFSSWQCAGPGVLLYDLDWTLVNPDGTNVTERHCEYAEVDLQAGTFSWASGPMDGCPKNATDSQFYGVEQLVNSTLSTYPREQMC
ncbi:hypothetical protein COHA_007052 [Chlorella ohadii]|uniref:Uncharacterized protein n=1 Tax=Chlorella ohadii TaxID=2649997 RepID=A0AAD5DJI2_9CHLO|nr:hypothetical protein COHA_007052 [Chlorella ohadii]